MFALLNYRTANNNKEKKMAIMQIYGVIPGNALGQAQLVSNMVALRNAQRAAGREFG